MKIIQSFWSSPLNKSKEDAFESRLLGGWPEKKYFYMSWALSCLQLCRFYENIEIFTDELGANLLIKKLELPYSSVHIVLDDMNGYNGALWAVGKLYTYKIQQDPFLHIDGDLFIWREFDRELMKMPIIVQSLEQNFDYYEVLMKDFDKHILWPDTITKYTKNKSSITAYNTGIVGGNDIEFIQHYCREAFEFINCNQESLMHCDLSRFNAIYEQALLFYLIMEKNKKVGRFTYTLGEEEIKHELQGLVKFKNAPNDTSLTHLYGKCKKDYKYCNVLEGQLKRNHHRYYERIMDLMSMGII